MSAQTLSRSLVENLAELRTILQGCDDFKYRPFTTATDIEGYLIYSHFLVDSQFISQTILPNLFNLQLPSSSELWPKTISRQLPFLPESSYTHWEDILLQLLDGNSLILLEGLGEAFVAETAEIEARPIAKPETEPIIRGPSEAFAEKLSPNLAIIRSRLKNPQLKINQILLGQESHTTVALLYLNGVIQSEVLAEVRRRLNTIHLDNVQDSGFLIEFLSEDTLSPFPLVQSTERSDKAVAALIEGRAVILVEGSPFAILLPTIFWHYFQASDDYFQNYLIASFIRPLRYLAYLFAVSLPSLYVVVTVFHPQLLPLRFLLSLTAARERVPISTFFEILGMLFVLDIFHEASLRLPQIIGPSIGIVGALIMGEAAVTAGIVSPLVVIIVALTAVTTFSIPSEDLRGTARMFSYFLVLLSSFLGLYGFLLGALTILLHLSSLESVGVPYLSPVSSFHWKEWTDVFIRAPWSNLRKKTKRLPSEQIPSGRKK
jgi:hypothetical protein